MGGEQEAKEHLRLALLRASPKNLSIKKRQSSQNGPFWTFFRLKITVWTRIVQIQRCKQIEERVPMRPRPEAGRSCALVRRNDARNRRIKAPLRRNRSLRLETDSKDVYGPRCRTKPEASTHLPEGTGVVCRRSRTWC